MRLNDVDLPLLPKYGPKLYTLSEYGEYRGWIARLLSMTLLEPKIPSPRYSEMIDRDQWRSYRIAMPGKDGIRVAFDSCECSLAVQVPSDHLSDSSAGSVHNFLPRDVVAKIWQQWLGHGPNAQFKRSQLVHNHPRRNFDGWDIVFEFMGSDMKKVSHRCSAKHFLSSPWTEGLPKGSRYCLVKVPKKKAPGFYFKEPTYVLGMVRVPDSVNVLRLTTRVP